MSNRQSAADGAPYISVNAFAHATENSNPEHAAPAVQSDNTAATAAANPDDPGVLTQLTGKLSAAEALSLYQRIAPRLALGVLHHLDQTVTLDIIQRVSRHLCHPDVQTRLRGYHHVRDGIIEELCSVLRDTRLRERLDRQSLLSIIEQTDMLSVLTTMERCLIVCLAA